MSERTPSKVLPKATLEQVQKYVRHINARPKTNRKKAFEILEQWMNGKLKEESSDQWEGGKLQKKSSSTTPASTSSRPRTKAAALAGGVGVGGAICIARCCSPNSCDGVCLANCLAGH